MTPEIAPSSILFPSWMKLFALLVAALFTIACTGNRTVARAALQFRTAAAAGYASTETATAIVATDEASYRNTWSSMVGSGEAPAIDFATETAVFLFAGQRPTGGYSVEVGGVTLQGDTLLVDATIKTPPPGGMATQAITSPYAVIAVNSRAVKNVRWDR